MTEAAFDAFKSTYLTDHDTAFGITRGRNTAYFAVRRLSGVAVWEVYGVRNNKERLIATYYGACCNTWDIAPEPESRHWSHLYWNLLGAIINNTLSDRYTVYPLAYCKRCGRLLTNPEHIARGYGTQCYIAILEEHQYDGYNLEDEL